MNIVPAETIDATVAKRAAVVALLTLLLYGAFLFVPLRRAAFNPSVFVTAGDEFTDKTAPRDLIVAPHSSGYDGQFYYRIACDPFSTKLAAWGVHFDYPVYRLQRIGYPMLVWMVSFGQRAAVPWMMIVVNLAALAGIGALGVLATQESRAAAWSGLALALYPGFLLSLSRDLVEPLEIFLILAAIVRLQRGRIPSAAVLLVLAALTKETSLLVPLGVLMAALITGLRRREHLLLLAPFAAHFGWKVMLFRMWRLPMTFVTGEHFMLPFQGIVSRARDAFASGETMVLIEMVAVAVFGVVVMLAFRASPVPREIKISWILYAALLFTLGAEFWWEDWAFLRVAVEFTIFGALIAMTSPRMRVAAQSMLTIGWLALAWNLLSFRG